MVEQRQTVEVQGDNALAETADTFSFDETDAAEQTMVTVTIAKRTKIRGIWIDMTNVTQNVTIKVYHAIDGTTPVLYSTTAFTVATDPDAVLIAGFTAYRDIAVTLKCAGGGAGAVDVPYAIV